MKRGFSAIVISLGLVAQAFGVSAEYQEAISARIENNYAMVQFPKGKKTLVPLAKLSESDLAFLTKLSIEKPLTARGKAEVVAAAPVEAKIQKTILSAKKEGTVETVQLIAPSVERNQIGGTCVLYAVVHYLDIGGYYVDNASIYRISNGVNPDNPWTNPQYESGIEALFRKPNPPPILHPISPAELDPFEWARVELRKGRPVLAAFPREIWQALPPGFIAGHPWGGGKVGHQIVVNGFTWDVHTGKGTFHIVNSWSELQEFDLTTDAAGGGAMIIMQSLSPRGEVLPKEAIAEKEIVRSVKLLRAVGKTNLYEVQTNVSTRRIVAASEDSARTLAEDGH